MVKSHGHPGGAKAATTEVRNLFRERAWRDVLQGSGFLEGGFVGQVDIQGQRRHRHRLRPSIGLLLRLRGEAALSMVMGQCWLSVRKLCRASMRLFCQTG